MVADIGRFALAWLKKWWALMSCAAFTGLSVLLTYVVDANKWIIRGTATLAVLFLFVAFFQLWREERQRAVDAEAKLNVILAKPPITSKDWQDLSVEAEKCEGLRVDHHWNSNNEHSWNVTGDRHYEICEMLLRRAGNMLLKSPNVSITLSSVVLTEADSLIRWMLYMDEHSAFWGGGVGDGYSQEGNVRVNHYSATTRHLKSDFVLLCHKCAALEI
jgi:hypothetical protein